MAPPTTHQNLPLPAELVIQICKNLDQADLKRCRLACKDFSYAAEISLFRQVVLKRNVESFMRLRLIADHPRISALVKALCYSGKMLWNAHLCKNIDDWTERFIGRGSDDRCSSAIREFSRTLTPQELQVHYQKFCAHRHNEQLLQKYDLETQDLTSAIAKLPQLDEVCFAYGKQNMLPNDDSVSLDQLSAVAQETLVEPEWRGGYKFHAGQFNALLKAAHTVQRPLHTIEALRVPWRAFQQSKEVTDMMASATTACQHLRIDLMVGPDKENGLANLAKMFSSAANLQTLEISLGFWYCGNQSNMLSKPFKAGAHWPNLKRLKLGSMKATDISLMNLLTIHATSLQSLELVNIYLEGYRLSEIEHHGSWVTILLSMQRSLSLKIVRLSGYLSNEWDEAWLIHDPDESEYWYHRDLRPEEGSCLKHRIERFIVEGGTCPLPMPHEAKESGGWNCIDFGADPSWVFDPEVMGTN